MSKAKSTKSNILYIASDDSSDNDSLNQQCKKDKTWGSNAAKPKFGLFGSHKLNNQVISKGFFHNHAHEEEYKFQVQKQPNKLIHSIQLNRRQPRKHIKSNQIQQNQKTRDKTIDKEKLKHAETQGNLEAAPPNLMHPKTTRSKTLLFQFDSQQQGNQIQNQNKKQPQIIQPQKPKQARFFSQLSQKKHIEPLHQEVQSIHSNLTNGNIHKIIKTNKLSFADMKIAKGYSIQAKIIKKNQISNFLYSQFDMFLRIDMTHMASCKKYPGNVGSNYRMSIDGQDFTYLHNNVIGKIRSSHKQQIYNIYDSGANPQKFEPKSSKKIPLRQILATVRIHVTQGPRSMQVYVLKQGSDYNKLMGTTLTKQLNLESLYNIKQNQQHIKLFKTRKPQWIPQFRQYFMNFGNRINESSIRNFILQDPETKQEVLFFGKHQNNIYHMDISYPLTPRLGLAIAIPQLDRDD